MGGFEGGDEAGFWEVDDASVPVSKQNNDSSTAQKALIDRSAAGYSIKTYDQSTIRFVPCQTDAFRIEGYDEVAVESHGIYKAYIALLDFTDDTDIVEFFCEHKVLLSEELSLEESPEEASCEKAAFILLVKEACNLVLTRDELIEIGRSIGADTSFFIRYY